MIIPQTKYFQNIVDMTLKTKVVFIDFETTGINVFNSDPIELGSVYVDENLKILNTFSSFIRPRITSRMKVSSIETHGLRMQDLLKKPTDKNVLENYFKLFGTDYCFAGWNISFDVPYFRKMCYRAGRMKEFNSINYRHIDIQTILRFLTEINMLPKEINSLDNCVNYFNLKRSDKHNALEDAMLTYEVFKSLLKLFHNYSKLS